MDLRFDGEIDYELSIVALELLERGYEVNAENLANNVDNITLEECQAWLVRKE